MSATGAGDRAKIDRLREKSRASLSAAGVHFEVRLPSKDVDRHECSAVALDEPQLRAAIGARTPPLANNGFSRGT